MSEDLGLQCTFCKGTGSVTCDCNCPHCDNEDDCDECDGTGFNPSVVDLDRWMDCAAVFRSEVRPAFNYKDDEGNLIGLRSSIVHKAGVPTIAHTLLAKNFLLNGDSDDDE